MKDKTGIKLTSTNSPCLNCNKRVVGCHSVCEQYIYYDKNNKRMRYCRSYYKIINA